MLVNFGLRERFVFDRNYFLPTGNHVLYQWDYMEHQRWNFREVMGSIPYAFYKTFEKKVVIPLSEIGGEYPDKECECTQSMIAKDTKHTGTDYESMYVLGLDDIFELMLRTSSLPDISPMFSPRKPINLAGAEIVPMNCMYGHRFDAVALTRTDKTKTQIGLGALARVPFSRFADGFFQDELWRIVDDLHSSRATNKQVASNGVKAFARLMLEAGATEPLHFTQWTDYPIRRAFWDTNRLLAPSMGVIHLMLQMASGQEYESYPKPLMVRVYEDREKLLRLASLVAAESNRIYNSEFKKDGVRKKAKALDYELLMEAADKDIDMSLITSLTDAVA